MTRWAGATRARWADWAGTVQPGLAGDSGKGREFFLAWHGNTFTADTVFTFERGEELDIAVLSLMYIL